jgi:hypothetical protein
MQYAGILLAEILMLYVLARKVHTGFGRLFYKLTKSEKVSAYLLAILFLPGTFVHEMAHFLTALFLLVPVGTVDLFPEVEEGKSVKLGSVGIAQTDFVRRTLIGFAPMFFGIAVILGSIYLATTRSLLGTPLSYIVLAYIVFEVGNTMFLSKRDLAGSWKVLVVLMVLVVCLYVLRLRVEISLVSTLFTQNVVEILKQASIFLVLPAVIDLVFVLMFKFAKII